MNSATATRYDSLVDRLYSVIGVADASDGWIEERVRYTPYGVARHFDAAQMATKGDVNGDGSIDFNDLNAVNGAFGGTLAAASSVYDPDCDFDQDGDVDGVDWNKVLSFYGQSYPTLAEGQLSRQTIANTVGYAGYMFDPATELYCVRFRWYDCQLANWMSRDPLKYFDGTNLSSYAMANPMAYMDALGLACTWEGVVYYTFEDNVRAEDMFTPARYNTDQFQAELRLKWESYLTAAYYYNYLVDAYNDLCDGKPIDKYTIIAGLSVAFLEAMERVEGSRRFQLTMKLHMDPSTPLFRASILKSSALHLVKGLATAGYAVEAKMLTDAIASGDERQIAKIVGSITAGVLAAGSLTGGTAYAMFGFIMLAPVAEAGIEVWAARKGAIAGPAFCSRLRRGIFDAMANVMEREQAARDFEGSVPPPCESDPRERRKEWIQQSCRMEVR